VWRGNTLNTANRSSQLYSVLDTFAAHSKPADVIEVGDFAFNAS